MKILGIETSCDETAAAVINDKKILSDVIYSQIKEHMQYGGIVPEIASKSHLNRIESIVSEAIQKANTQIKYIDYIAVTSHPGLIGSLLIGSMFAKGLAIANNKPIIAVNHIVAHALVIRMFNDISFPYISVVVSGGHTQIMLMESATKFTILGKTLDDSAGECFDKVARMLGLTYPGGPAIEKLAVNGCIDTIPLPIPLVNDNSCHFSFSGLKTACMQYIKKHDNFTEKHKADFCASFQHIVACHIKQRLQNLYSLKKDYKDLPIVISGGVGANRYITSYLSLFFQNLFILPIRYCSDNAVMIAWAANEMINDQYYKNRYNIDFKILASKDT